MSFKNANRVIGPDNRDNHTQVIAEIIDYYEREGFSEQQTSIAVLEYCQSRNVTLQQLEKDEHYQ